MQEDNRAAGRPATRADVRHQAGHAFAGVGRIKNQALAARGTTTTSLLAHIESMRSHVAVRKPEPAAAAGASDRLIRLQDRGPEPVVVAQPPPPKPGFFRRIGMMLGL